MAVSGGAAVLLACLLPDVGALAEDARTGAVAGQPFDDVLVSACEVALVVCTVWLWLSTVAVTAGAANGDDPAPRGVPRVWRRLVLAACGVALAGGLAAPAHAGDGRGVSLVDGLPLPDRATTTAQVSRLFARAESHPAPARRGSAHSAPQPELVLVRPGDTLWDLARAELPPGAGNTAIATRVRQIHRANRAVIGADPDLIRPHQRLRMPTTTREESR
jgi:nucleoid-associated protein YgaU